MKILKINNREVNIPTETNELSISQFEKLMKLVKTENTDRLERNIDLLKTSTDLTEEDIDSLMIAEFNDIVANLKFESLGSIENCIREFELNGIKYKSSSNANDYKFTVKEHRLIKKSLIGNSDGYVSDLAAIIFKEEGGDLSEESFSKRKVIFQDAKMDVICPYILMLQEKFLKPNAN